MSEALRTLILEDRLADAELVTRELRKAGFEFAAKIVATEKEFLAELRDFAPQLILADYSLPGYDGLSALVAAQKQCPETPFIFVSGSMGEEKAIETLHRGATDYVLKQRLAQLGPAVRRALREREERRKGEQAEKARHEAETGLRESEKQLRGMFDLASVGMAQADPQTGQWLRVNQKMCAITGYSAAELLRMRVFEITHPDDRQKDWEEFQRVVRGEAPDYRLEKRYVRKDGAVAWVNVNMTVILDAAGQPVRTMATIEDITERRQAGQRICELNLVLRATGAINALMARERDPPRLLAEACKILVETRGYQFAWIGQVEPGSKRVVPAARAGKDADYLEAVTITWDETPTGQGPIGTAIRSGQPMACQDMATDPRFAPWRKEAIARGFASVAAMPMVHGSRVLGAVAVYSGRVGAFDAEELDLLKELAGDLAFALQSIEHEQERRWAEESLGENERRYRLLFNSGYDAVFVHQGGGDGNAGGKFIEVNDIACQRLGYTREELLQMTPQDISAPETLPDIPGIRAKLAAEKSAVSEGVHITKDGRRIPVEISTHVFELNGRSTRLSAVRDITDRKQAEAALRESSQFSQQIITSAQEGIVVYGRDLKYQVWNPYMERLTGRPASEVLGEHPGRLFPFLQEAGLLASIERVLAGEQVSALEVHVEGQPTGISGWTSQTNAPLRNAAGEIIGVIGIVRDITESKHAALRIAAFASVGQRLNTTRTAREAGRIIVDVADELLGWDCCFFHLYSAPENKVSHLLCLDLINGQRTEWTPPDFSRSPTELARRVIEQGGQLILRDPPDSMPMESVPFGDTSRRSASILIVPIRSRTEAVGILSIQSYTPRAYDAVSLETLQALADHGAGALERLRAQEELAESEATFRSVWECSADGMRLTDKEGRIIAVNEAFCRLVKLPREKLEGQIFSVAYKGHGPTDGIELYQKRFATGDIVSRLTTRTQLWNAEEVDLETSNTIIELGQRGRMLLSIFRDISERKRAELRIAAFAQLGRRLGAAKTAKDAATIIVGVADELLGWDACLFDLYFAAENRVMHLLSMDLIAGRRAECEPPHRNPLPGGFSRQAIEQGGLLVLRDHADTMRPEGVPFGESTRTSASIMFVPVRNGAEVVGVFSIQSYTPRAYDADSLKTLQALADYGGGALDRVRTEELLRASEVRYRRLFEAAKDGVLILDAETGMVVDVNPFLLQLLGFPREAFLEKKVWELGFFKDLLANEANFETLRQQEFIRYDDKPLETADGRRIDVEFVSNVYEVDRKKVIQCNIRDITARKRTEWLGRIYQDQLRALSARIEAMREEERTRISREIHDELGQMLTGIKMDLRWMEHRLDEFGDDRRVNPILDKLVATAELTDATVKTVQRIAAELRPGILDKLGLPMALQYETAQFRERTGIACRLVMPSETMPLQSKAATAFFRILQETLTNVARHAKATAVEVELQPEADGCRLEIRDNGQGMAGVDLTNLKSLGLLGIHERAALLGGEATFTLRPGGGTIVTVRIPNVLPGRESA